MSTDGASPLDRLLGIMAHLRHPERGCAWDRAQSFATIAPYTIEEAYEVADAITRNDMAGLRDELGDLLLQVVFHARIAEEAGHFAFPDVAAAVADKLERRHPHLFAAAAGAEAAQAEDGQEARRERWEALKAAERIAEGADSALAGVALALPALMRAEKLQKRAARVGFDWPDAAGPAEKLREEMEELADCDDAGRMEEAGDLLFSAVNLVRAYGVAPEDALRAANAKFERRFRAMERLAGDRGDTLGALPLEQQEALWQEVKRDERK